MHIITIMDEIIHKSLDLDYEVLSKITCNPKMSIFFKSTYKITSKDILKEFDNYVKQAKELFQVLDDLFNKVEEERHVRIFIIYFKFY